MFAYPIRAAALTLAAAIGLSACTTPYGYSGVSVGYGNAGYYDPYYEGYGYSGYGYSRLGYGYGYSPYWGWNDGFYYPGTGYYVYDRYRRPYRWTDAQRRYWNLRRQQALASSTSRDRVIIRNNWRDFDSDRVKVRSNRVERTIQRPVRAERNRPARVDRSTVRVERSSRPTRVERSTARAEGKEARELRRSEVRATRTNSRRNGQDRED